MSLLHVSLFGTVSVWHEDEQKQLKLTPVIQELLAFLLLSSRYPHPRDVLAELLWGEYSQEKARGCLKTALWRLRNALEPQGIPSGTYLLSTVQGEIAFNYDSPHWVDVDAFIQQVTPVLSRSSADIHEADAEACNAALKLYTGDLMEGFYDDWAIQQRERLRTIYLETLTRMVQYYRDRRQPDRGIYYARCILEIDPLREEIHREMMHLYLESGQRPQAIKQYELCQAVLQRELGISPMEETQQLHSLIMSTAIIPVTSSQQQNPYISTSALNQLQAARQALNQAQEQFDKASQIIESLLLLQEK
jgi:DNA-binding SARP family transcriptional activator